MLRTREILRVHIRISSWPSQSSSQQWRLPFIPQFRSRSQTCMRAGPAPHRVNKICIFLSLFSNPGVYWSCCILSELPGFGARCESSAHPPAVAVPPPWRDEGHPPECLTRNQKPNIEPNTLNKNTTKNIIASSSNFKLACLFYLFTGQVNREPFGRIKDGTLSAKERS